MVFREFSQGYPVFIVGQIFRDPWLRRRILLSLFCTIMVLSGSMTQLVVAQQLRQPSHIANIPQATGTAASLQQKSRQAVVQPTPQPIPAPAPTVSAATPAVATKPKATAPTASCTAVSNAQPSQVNLSDKTPGVYVVNDPVHYYQIYGNTAAQLRSQVQKCSSSGFAGETSYILNSQYNIMAADGFCSVTDVKVGIHVIVTMPAWQSTGNLNLSNQWNNFSNNLLNHENGHVALNREYASRLQTSLQSIQATDCNTAKANARSIIKANAAALEAANEAYDQQTGHGATQGAVLPR